jgi:hypothetical protein
MWCDDRLLDVFVSLYGCYSVTIWGVDREQLDSVAFYGAEIGNFLCVDRELMYFVSFYGAEIGKIWGVDREQLDSVAFYRHAKGKKSGHHRESIPRPSGL